MVILGNDTYSIQKLDFVNLIRNSETFSEIKSFTDSVFKYNTYSRNNIFKDTSFNIDSLSLTNLGNLIDIEFIIDLQLQYSKNFEFIITKNDETFSFNIESIKELTFNEKVIIFHQLIKNHITEKVKNTFKNLDELNRYCRMLFLLYAQTRLPNKIELLNSDSSEISKNIYSVLLNTNKTDKDTSIEVFEIFLYLKSKILNKVWKNNSEKLLSFNIPELNQLNYIFNFKGYSRLKSSVNSALTDNIEDLLVLLENLFGEKTIQTKFIENNSFYLQTKINEILANSQSSNHRYFKFRTFNTSSLVSEFVSKFSNSINQNESTNIQVVNNIAEILLNISDSELMGLLDSESLIESVNNNKKSKLLTLNFKDPVFIQGFKISSHIYKIVDRVKFEETLKVSGDLNGFNISIFTIILPYSKLLTDGGSISDILFSEDDADLHANIRSKRLCLGRLKEINSRLPSLSEIINTISYFNFDSAYKNMSNFFKNSNEFESKLRKLTSKYEDDFIELNKHLGKLGLASLSL